MREGIPINAVVQQRENRSNNGKGGEKPHLTILVSLNGSTTAYATKKLQAEGGGERGKKDGQTTGTKDTKKTTHKSLDDKNSRRSKHTKSDDKVLAIEGEQPDGIEVNLDNERIIEEEGDRHG